MHLISPEVLTDAKGLSVGATGFFLFVGFLIWAMGWRWHKFWVVFAITVTAGLLGLGAGRASGTQVLAVGVLVAIAAGVLALEIAKITAFITGGTAAWLAAQAVMPEAQELWAAFLSGGLLGVVLYRMWTMLATALIGALVFWHALFLMLDTLGAVNAVEIVTQHHAALNTAILAATVIGAFVQSKTGSEAAEEAEEKKAEKKAEKPTFLKPMFDSFNKLMKKAA
jgi:hypothetical protein